MQDFLKSMKATLEKWSSNKLWKNEDLVWLDQFPREEQKIHKDEDIILTLADNYLYNNYKETRKNWLSSWIFYKNIFFKETL